MAANDATTRGDASLGIRGTVDGGGPAAAGGTRLRADRPKRQPPLLLGHERVAVVGRRHERLLDRARARPADQVPHRTGLVVGAGCTATAERLLPDHGAG